MDSDLLSPTSGGEVPLLRGALATQGAVAFAVAFAVALALRVLSRREGEAST